MIFWIVTFKLFYPAVLNIKKIAYLTSSVTVQFTDELSHWISFGKSESIFNFITYNKSNPGKELNLVWLMKNE